ncbi:LexA family transcriptional regulator [Acetobacter senegalensis]|uniref:LexA family transcriptional regulator n=1 Tax=Acetobacter senegalensis TaxID=446692 RepID=UPI002653EB81|nr:LexA family transcriptional regulator [Acetobacter senegalensis]MDN7351684.1 LexA family transcriptional regulator [Acetobacter senegalensis]
MSDDHARLLRERGERLRQAAQSIGITHAAKAAGVPYTTLRDYMNGSEMKLSAVASLARACGVSLDWLAFGVGVGLDTGSEGTLPIRGGHQVVIPWLSPQPDEGLRVGKSWLEAALPRDPAMLRLVSVSGDAMAPTLREGDLVIVDTGARAVQGGAIFALRVEGDILLRRLERRLGGGIRALADNDRYPPQELQTAEAAGLDVVGEVVWSGGLPRG